MCALPISTQRPSCTIARMEAGLVKPTQPTVLVGAGRRVGRRLGWRHQPSKANQAYDPCRCRAARKAGVGWVGTINPASARSEEHSAGKECVVPCKNGG